jgi:hypothetical protein
MDHPFHFDGVSIEPSVRKRLRRLDKQLLVTFSPYSLDPHTGQPIEARRGVDPETGERFGGLVHDPAYHLWRKDSYSSHHFYIRAYPQFTHREAAALENDIARFVSANHLGRVLREREEEKRAKALAAEKGFRQDKAEANEKRIRRLITGEDRGLRDVKSFSYAGQSSRVSAGEKGVIYKDRRADGWE